MMMMTILLDGAVFTYAGFTYNLFYLLLVGKTVIIIIVIIIIFISYCQIFL